MLDDVRNKLGHPPVDDQISEQECDAIFVRLDSFVDVLHALHPDIVSTPADIKTKLQKVGLNSVFKPSKIILIVNLSQGHGLAFQ